MGQFGLIFVICLALAAVQGDTFYDEEDILDVPYMVAILGRIWDTHEYGFICNGVIVRNDLILTTATCFTRSPNNEVVMIRVGSAFADRGGNIITVYASNILLHRQFSPDLDADIALIKLNRPLILSSRVAVLKLPEKNSTLDSNVLGKYITWSISSSTQTVVKFDMYSLSNSACREKYPSKELYTDNMMCTGASRFFCGHRPGGPFIFNETLYGLYSWTYRCGLQENPGVFTRVSAFISWIDAQSPAH